MKKLISIALASAMMLSSYSAFSNEKEEPKRVVVEVCVTTCTTYLFGLIQGECNTSCHEVIRRVDA